MKSILLNLSIALLAVALSSCTESVTSEPPPDPVKTLKAQVETERQARQEAEAAKTNEASLRRRWEWIAVAASVFAMSAFVAGAALGSRGKRHALASS